MLCFYAVSALLASRGLSSAKHSGVRSLFGRHFVKIGIVPAQLAALHNELYEYRQESDCEDFFSIDPSLLPDWIARSEGFVETLAGLARPSEPR